MTIENAASFRVQIVRGTEKALSGLIKPMYLINVSHMARERCIVIQFHIVYGGIRRGKRHGKRFT